MPGAGKVCRGAFSDPAWKALLEALETDWNGQGPCAADVIEEPEGHVVDSIGLLKPSEPMQAVAVAKSAVAEELFTAPLDFEVSSGDSIKVRAQPNNETKIVGQLLGSQRLSGFPGEGWLRLVGAPGSSLPRGCLGGWVQLNERVVPTCSKISVRGSFVEAVDVEWPGLEETEVRGVKVMYLVEWKVGRGTSSKPPTSLSQGHHLSVRPRTIVSRLPRGTALELRVVTRLLSKKDATKDVRFTGKWIDVDLAQPIADELEIQADVHTDPFGIPRVGCVASGCFSYLWVPGLADTQDEVKFNDGPESICCVRCGRSFTQHGRGLVEDAAALESYSLMEWTVVHPFVNVRSARSIKGGIVGILRQGTVVRGRREGSWLRLDRRSSQLVVAGKSGRGEGMDDSPEADTLASSVLAAWVLTDGSSSGLGTLLMPTTDVPRDMHERWRREELERVAKNQAVRSSAIEVRRRRAEATHTESILVRPEVGLWGYGTTDKPLEYKISADGSSGMRFEGPHVRVGVVSGELDENGGWLESELADPGGNLVGYIRLQYDSKDCVMLSNFRSLNQTEWGRLIKASRIADNHIPTTQETPLGDAPADNAASEPSHFSLCEPRPEFLTQVYKTPLKFSVAQAKIKAREKPCLKSAQSAWLTFGEEVTGWQQGDWLKLQEGIRADDLHGWVYVATEPGSRHPNLVRRGPELRIKCILSEAAILEWDPVPARSVEYTVEWATKSEPENIIVVRSRETMTMCRVHGLTADTEVMFRITAVVLTKPREEGGETFAELATPWEEGETGPEIDEVTESNMCLDPLANFRGRCMDCGCHGFVLSDAGDLGSGFRDTLDDLICRRCSCSCTRHFIIGEFQYRRTVPGGTQAKGTRRSVPAEALPPTNSGSKEFDLKTPAISQTSQRSASKQEEEQLPRTWRPDDAGDGDRVKFVLDKIAEAQTLYEVLGICPSVDDDAVRHAFRQVSLNVHPDKVQHRDDNGLRQQAESAFKIISSAYEVLGEPQRRTMYDRKVLRSTSTLIRTGCSTRNGLTGLSFLRKFLGKTTFGWDLSAKPPGDQWEDRGNGMYGRSTKLNVHVIHAITGEELKIQVEPKTTVKQLKTLIVEKVRRGPASRIEIVAKDGSELAETCKLSGAGSETMLLVGVPIGPPKEIGLCLCHAHTGARVRLRILDTSTIVDVRQALMEKFPSWDGKKLRLGIRAANADRFEELAEKEYLNGREQMLLLGVDIAAKLSKEEAVELQTELIDAYAAPWFQRYMSELLEDFPPPDGIEHPMFQQRFSSLLRKAQHATLVKQGFDGPRGVVNMMHAFSEVSLDPDILRLSKAIDQKLRVTDGCVLPRLTDFLLENPEQDSDEKCIATIKVPERCSISDVRRIIAHKFNVPAESIRFPKDAIMQAVGEFIEREEGETLGKLKCLQVVGVDLAKMPVLQPTHPRRWDLAEVPDESVGGGTPAQSDDVTKRLAEDGNFYTLQEFISYYGKDGRKNWDWAAKVAQRKKGAEKMAETDKKITASSTESASRGDVRVDPTSPQQTETPEEAAQRMAAQDAQERNLKLEAIEAERRVREEASKRLALDAERRAKEASAQKQRDDDVKQAREIAEAERELTVWHLNSENAETVAAELTVRGGSSMLLVRRQLAHAVGRPEVIEFGRLVAKSADGVYRSLRDAERVHGLARGERLLLLNANADVNDSQNEAPEELYTQAEACRVQPGSGGASSFASLPAKSKQGKANEKPTKIEISIRSIHNGRTQKLNVEPGISPAKVLRELADALGRPEVCEAKLLRRSPEGSGYVSFKDDEECTNRKQLFVMNACLDPVPGSLLAEPSPEQRKQAMSTSKKSDKANAVLEAFPVGTVVVTARSTILRKGEDLESSNVSEIKVGQMGKVQGHGARFFRRIQVELLPDGPLGWLTTSMKNGDVIIEKASETQIETVMPVTVPKTVMVTITPAVGGGDWIELFVPDNSTLGSLKESLAERFGRKDILQRGRFVQRRGPVSFGGLRDEELLGNRRDFLYMGTDLR